MPRHETLLIVDDEPDFIATTSEQLRRVHYDVFGATSLSEARLILQDHFIDLLLLDERIGREIGTRFLGEIRQVWPGACAIIISGHADLHMAMKAMRAGAVDMLAKPFRQEELLESVHRVLAATSLLRQSNYNRWYAERESRLPEIVGESDALRRVLTRARGVAGADSTVLIQGESGVGKDLVARAIHAASPRRHNQMVIENIGALAPEIVESTLFGHKKGSFTGALSDHIGLFEAATGGTLFLDEIGEASPSVQVRLLRAIDQKKIIRLGENTVREVDVRLIAATNRELRSEVEAHRFREDLYYRLHVVQIDVPPLRERSEDIEPLARFFLDQQNRKQGKRLTGFDHAAIEKMMQYRWPGNVRELKNSIEAAVMFAAGPLVIASDLHFSMIDRLPSERDDNVELTFKEAEVEFERRYFRRVLQRANGNRSRAAEAAGMDRSALYAHLRKIGLTENES